MKTVLITGAGTRIGSHLARGLAADGWTVAIHYNRSKTAALELATEIKKNGGDAVAVCANLNVPHDLDSLVNRASDAAGQPITALINNASTFEPDDAENFTSGTLNFHMNVNLNAPIFLSQAFAIQLPDGISGNIINILDQRLLDPEPEFFTYTISKAALHWATKTMAQSFAPRIRVNAIGPGPTLQSKHQTDQEFADEIGQTLLKRPSNPESILGATRYLLGAESVTGQFLAVDSGQHLHRNL